MNIKNILFSIFFVGSSTIGFTQISTSEKILAKIRNEGYQNSQVMPMLKELTDVYGQRLSGSHEYFAAAQWMLNKMKELGFENAHFENYCENCRGWSINSFNIEMIAPNYMKIAAYPLAMTKSTGGIVEGEIVHISSYKDLNFIKAQWSGNLNGKIVLLGTLPKKKSFGSFSNPISEKRLNEMEQQLVPTKQRAPLPETLKSWEMDGSKEMKFLQFLESEGTIAVLKTASTRFGAVRADGTYYYRKDDLKPLPFFAIMLDHFSRLLRLVDQNVIPKIRLNLETEHYFKPDNNVNIIGELTGQSSKLKSETILVGAHFDSWHAGTGANDNGASCIVLVEALRILKAIGYAPKRTIKIGLWGGEEQALMGSVAYAKSHFGNFDQPNIESTKVSTYLNLDNGSGLIRGIHLQQNEFARPVFEEIFDSMPSVEEFFVSIENTFSTDHFTFDHYNIPSFQFIQDPTPYAHTQLDLIEYVPKEDVMKNAVIMAWTIYSLSEMNAKVPRKK